MDNRDEDNDGDGSHEGRQLGRDVDGAADNAEQRAPIQKRVKTGCLTCRKRRIKCDEGRPICNNCTKSKRQCDYTQRFQFRKPLGMYDGVPVGSLHYHGRPTPAYVQQDHQLAAAQQRLPSQPLLAPKPPSSGPAYPILPLHPHMYVHAEGSAVPQSVFGEASGPSYTHSQAQANRPLIPDVHSQTNQAQRIQYGTAALPLAADASSVSPELSSNGQSRNNSTTQPEAILNEYVIINNRDPRSFDEAQDWDFEDYRQDELMDESDEEDKTAGAMLQLRGSQAGIFVAHMLRNPHDPHGILPRYFEASPFTSMATYDPEPSQSPLNDEQIRAVFSHFIRVTGPSISMYERHSHDIGSMAGGQQLARPQRHIWTSTFPVLAFTHPALLQAILALASLQIARLERNQPTASLKHYHLALQRIARNVGRPVRRTQPANLAATLLLAYWEVWNSDHEKWCRHMLGARWIMKDIPFLSMSKAVLARRMQERFSREQMRAQAQCDGFAGFTDDSDPAHLHKDWDLIDTSLLRVITGRVVSYVDPGFGNGSRSFSSSPRQPITDRDIETYETLSDLYWWYCKMDIYQSILGGQKLFMDYNKWLACPPRAPIGRLDALYGTFDHLVLLIARMSDFNARDQARKKTALSRSAQGPKAPPAGAFPGLVPTSGHVPMPAGFSPPRDTTPEDQESKPEVDFETQTAAAFEEWASIRQAFEVFKNALGPEFAPLGPDVCLPLNTPFGPSRHYRTFSVAGIWLNYYMGLIMLYRAHPSMPPIAMMAAGLQAPITAEWAMEIGRIAVGVAEDTSAIRVVSTLDAAGLIECAFPLFVAGVQYREDQQRQWLIRRLHDTARLTGWESARPIALGCESSWVKAFELKRGPPYIRDPELDSVSVSQTLGSRRLDVRIAEIDSEGGDGTQERKGKIEPVENPGLAMGLLLVEQDFQKLELDDRGS